MSGYACARTLRANYTHVNNSLHNVPIHGQQRGNKVGTPFHPGACELEKGWHPGGVRAWNAAKSLILRAQGHLT